MNKGFRSFPRPRNKKSVGVEQVIDTTNGNTFRHGFGRVPGNVVVMLRCITSNNGFAVGDEMPLHALFRTIGSNTLYWFERHTPQVVQVFIPSTNVQFLDAAAGLQSFTAANWRLVFRCADIERPI